jgi:hypothetical protein
VRLPVWLKVPTGIWDYINGSASAFLQELSVAYIALHTPEQFESSFGGDFSYHQIFIPFYRSAGFNKKAQIRTSHIVSSINQRMATIDGIWRSSQAKPVDRIQIAVGGAGNMSVGTRIRTFGIS